MAEEGFLDAPGAGCSDALVDGESLSQAGDAFAGVAVLEVAEADAFQGACFFQGRGEVSGNGQRLGVVVAGAAAGRGSGQQFL
jgi:hypothetical protein